MPDTSTVRKLGGISKLGVFRVVNVATACLCLASASVWASPADRDEARQRFDRGLALYDAGDFSGALAEFQRAHEVSGHPLVLYNMALVHARLGNAVEAVNACEELARRGFAELGKERAERARKVHEEQLSRVGTLQIDANIADATIQLDNFDIDRKSSAAVRVTAGTHLVSSWKAGYGPRHIAVTVAGREHKLVRVELTPLQEQTVLLKLTSNVPDVEVREAGQLLGKLPMATALPLAPGAHVLDFTREGYNPVRRLVHLPPGDRGQLNIAMSPSGPGLARGATLSLALSEPNAVVIVDGEPRREYSRRLRLPVGRHWLRVQRAGFFDVSREVVLPSGTSVLDVQLLPKPEFLDDYVARANRQRALGLITAGAGAVLAASGGGFLIWNQGRKNETESELEGVNDRADQNTEGCRTRCKEQRASLGDDLEEQRMRDVYGWLGVGVGAAALGTGALIYFLADDPGRYDPKPESDVFASLKLSLGVGALALSGAF
jgi:hypothetical protein